MRNPVGESIDIAVGAVRLLPPGERTTHRDFTLSHQKSIEGGDKFRRESPARSSGNPEPDRHPTTARRQRASSPAHGYPRRARHARAQGYPRRAARASGHALSGTSDSEACSAPMDAKSRSELRHCSSFSGSNEWLSSRCTSSSSNGAQRPVVPNVPSRVARPARPAIWASSAGLSLRN